MSIFAFHHIGLCKSSHLCVKLSPSSIPCFGTCSYSNQIDHVQGRFISTWFKTIPGLVSLLTGWNWAFKCSSSPPSLQLQELQSEQCSCLPWVLYLLYKTTLLVLLTGGVVECLTQFSGQVLFSSPKGISSSRPTGSQTLEYLRVWLLPLREPQDPVCLTLFVVLCVLLNKFYCFSFRTRIVKPASSLDKL